MYQNNPDVISHLAGGLKQERSSTPISDCSDLEGYLKPTFDLEAEIMNEYLKPTFFPSMAAAPSTSIQINNASQESHATVIPTESYVSAVQLQGGSANLTQIPRTVSPGTMSTTESHPLISLTSTSTII